MQDSTAVEQSLSEMKAFSYNHATDTKDEEQVDVLYHISPEESLARISDIIIPFEAKPVTSAYHTQHACGDIVLYYQTSQAISAVSLWYQQNMERMGWRLLCDVKGGDRLLTFEKPHQWCSIYLHEVPASKKYQATTEFTLFVSAQSE